MVSMVKSFRDIIRYQHGHLFRNVFEIAQYTNSTKLFSPHIKAVAKSTLRDIRDFDGAHGGLFVVRQTYD